MTFEQLDIFDCFKRKVDIYENDNPEMCIVMKIPPIPFSSHSSINAIVINKPIARYLCVSGDEEVDNIDYNVAMEYEIKERKD